MTNILHVPRKGQVKVPMELIIDWMMDNFSFGDQWQIEDGNPVALCLLDDEDYEDAINPVYDWYLKIDNSGDLLGPHITATGYKSVRTHVSIARAPLKTGTEYKIRSHVLMSRHILRMHMKGISVEHINGDQFDFRRHNLIVKKATVETLIKMREHWLENARIEAGLPA